MIRDSWLYEHVIIQETPNKNKQNPDEFCTQEIIIYKKNKKKLTDKKRDYSKQLYFYGCPHRCFFSEWEKSYYLRMINDVVLALLLYILYIFRHFMYT